MLHFLNVSPAQGSHEPTALQRKEPLPPVGPSAPPMQLNNPRTTTYARADFLQGRVMREQVFAEYKAKPVQHRGQQIARNADEFNAATNLTTLDRKMPPTQNYESMIATLGPALDALTGGAHPKIDWTQPVVMPPDHPKINQSSVLKAQMLLGFGEEKRDFNNDVDANERTDVTDNASISTIQGVVDAADKFVRAMYDISSDSENDENKRENSPS